MIFLSLLLVSFSFLQLHGASPAFKQEVIPCCRGYELPDFKEVLLGGQKPIKNEYAFFRAFQDYWYNSSGIKAAEEFKAHPLSWFAVSGSVPEPFNRTLHKFCSGHIFEKFIQKYRDLRTDADFCIGVRAYSYIKKYHLTTVEQLIDCEAIFVAMQVKKCSWRQAVPFRDSFKALVAQGMSDWLQGNFLKYELAKNNLQVASEVSTPKTSTNNGLSPSEVCSSLLKTVRFQGVSGDAGVSPVMGNSEDTKSMLSR